MTGIALTFELRKFGKFGPNLVRRRVGGLNNVPRYFIVFTSSIFSLFTFISQVPPPHLTVRTFVFLQLICIFHLSITSSSILMFLSTSSSFSIYHKHQIVCKQEQLHCCFFQLYSSNKLLPCFPHYVCMNRLNSHGDITQHCLNSKPV